MSSTCTQTKRFAWSDDAVSQLLTLARAGLSHGQISQKMGIARGAVSAKLRRLGHTRETPTRPIKIPRVRLPYDRSGDVDNFHRAVARQQHEAEARSDLLTIAELTDESCRYVVGEPAETRIYCGHNRVPGLPYCGEHAARCYREIPISAPLRMRHG